MGPDDLAQVLRPLVPHTHPNLIAGLSPGDDAAVYLISERQAIVQTLDFFPPIVDDPYTFGAIAAANSMSDVFAMGGEVTLALNIAAFPDKVDKSVLTTILRGGADKVLEAGGVVAGGHTVTDPEPKYGLCVTGLLDPVRMMTKAGARPGDRLLLTKPIGTGVITTAGKNDMAKPESLQGAVNWMLKLNGPASRVFRWAGVRSCTDVTGFGLLGHASEMAEASGVAFVIRAASVPIMDGAVDAVRDRCIPGGLGRNREYVLKKDLSGFALATVEADEEIEQLTLLFDPQTSGGLLASVPSGRVEDVHKALEEQGVTAWEIGEVLPGRGIQVI